MKELDHTFGDDGIFWISLDDFLKAWNEIDRTRLFGPGWTVAQQWTTVSVPRTINYSDTTYLKTTFKVHITCGKSLLCGPFSFPSKISKGRTNVVWTYPVYLLLLTSS